MKTLEDLKHFYDTHLSADLEVLEQKQKEVLRSFIHIGIKLLCVVAIIVLIGLITNPVFILPLTVSAIATSWLVCKYSNKSRIMELNMEFKILVIDRIVRFVDKNLSYDRRGYIPKSTFMLSQIFKWKPNRYEGDDLVAGKVGETKIQFCELNAGFMKGEGDNRSKQSIIDFVGLFFVADFNKNFSCKTVVLPDTAEEFFGRIGQKLQSMNIVRDDLVKLDDPEFEKHFVVYSDDQVGARYILSTSLMKSILDFKKKSNRKIYLSFIRSMVFVAIPYTRKLFEPKIFTTLFDFEPIREYFEDLQLAIGIVDDLNLNTRIWSKQ